MTLSVFQAFAIFKDPHSVGLISHLNVIKFEGFI